MGVLATFLWARFLSSDPFAAAELQPCQETSLLSNALLLSNLVASPCYGDLWTVSLVAQLYLVVPFAVYLYASRRCQALTLT